MVIIIRLYKTSKLFSFLYSKGNNYFSYACIFREESNALNHSHWYKFDDTDVSDCKMDDDELRSQCFGGDYSTQSFDQPVMKRYLLISFVFSVLKSPFF